VIAIDPPVTADLLLLYPAESLKKQISRWALQHPERQVDVSFERSLAKIRHLLRYTDATLLDATHDPAMATEAFLQAVACLGADAVAVYTETLHDDLELFVRLRGVPFFLGPLFDEQWEEFFEQIVRAKRPLFNCAARCSARLVG
jgi:hypothetical protein